MPPPSAFGFALFNKPPDYHLDFQNPGVYIFANALTWVNSQKNPEYRKTLESATLLFPDGIGTTIACKLHSGKTPKRLPGPNFTHQALKAWKHNPMVFIGGTHSGFTTLKEKYQLTQASQIIPPFRDYNQKHVEEELKKHPDLLRPHQIIWVCLGAPKQELWANHAAKLLPNSRFFPIGAAFAFLSGEKKRAPIWMQKTGLEWCHRTLYEPKRLLKRTLLGNSQLLFQCILFLLKKKLETPAKNPTTTQ